MKIKLLNQLINWTIFAVVFLLPLFYLPLTTNFYEFNKQALLFAAVCLLTLAWCLKLILTRSLKLKFTPFDLPVLLLAAAYLISTFTQAGNRVETIFVPNSTGTIVLMAIFYLLLVNNLERRDVKALVWAQVAGAVGLSVLALASFSGLTALLVPASASLEWLRLKFWTPAGNLLALIAYLAVFIPFLAVWLYPHSKEIAKKPATFLATGGSFIIIAAGLAVSLFQLLTTAKMMILPQSIGWQIAVDTIKTSPLFGVGPNNFLSAFTQFKPLSFNQTDLWSVWFQISSNVYFHLFTTIGLVGLLALFYLAFRVVKTSVKHLRESASEEMALKRALVAAFLMILVLFALLPINYLVLFAFFTILASLSLALPSRDYEESSKVLPWAISLPLFVLVALAGFYSQRIYRAEVYFKQSLEAIAKNSGTDAYNLQIQAIALNPDQASYRTAYSQTNFALANALAQKKDLTDQDRSNISILIQQAIREAKAAVALAPQNASNWENLALTYRSLINFAQGADQWTIGAYNQAIALDPYNPNLRLALGGVYYSLNQYDDAIKFFDQTITLKPDMANGYYNLSAAYREKGDLTKAVAAMENVVRLIKVGSDDGAKAQSELDALKKRLAEKAEVKPTTTSNETTTLNPPQPLPKGIKPPLTLPTGAGPEITPTTAPTPTVEVTPTLAPTISPVSTP